MEKSLPDCLFDQLPEHNNLQFIPKTFSDSTHDLWRLYNSDKSQTNYILKVCSNIQSSFWQIMSDLFDFDLVTEIPGFSITYDFIDKASSINLPQLLKSETINGYSYILTTELHGDACVSDINDHMVSQLATHLAELHSKKSKVWGSLNHPKFNSDDWSRRLKIILEECASQAQARQRRNAVTPTRRANETSKKWGGVFLQSDFHLKQAIEACDAIEATEFVPMIPDLRWDQFLQKDNKISGFVDLDAFVYAPRELDFVILEYILSSSQFEIFKDVYSKHHSIPDLTLVRPAYRLLLFYMQILGESDIDVWMSKEISI